MRLSNLAYVVLIFLIPVVPTLLTLGNPWFVWLNYGIWLSIVVGFLIFLNFLLLYLRSRNMHHPLIQRRSKRRFAVFVTSFNEDPDLVIDTLLSIKSSLGNMGDIFLLDDSTDREKSDALRRFCLNNGIVYIHREVRRGFKAGAINDALRLLGNSYELLAIFDADQRPVEGFFEEALHYFNDPRIAFVQIPQQYSETRSSLAKAAKYQQEPFLRVIMRGRDLRSAFSLGSGTVFRVSVLREVGGFLEDSVTEDVATSMRIHESGYDSIYVDAPLVWYGEPPLDLRSYLTQQARWSFGYFQIFRRIIGSNLEFPRFMDYFSGFLYWLKEGPITLFELLGPIVFLLLGVNFIVFDAVIYGIAYGVYLAVSLLIFISAVRSNEYGFRGFIMHQALEHLSFPAITSSFISWLMGRRLPFRVTPKRLGRRSIGALAPHLLILTLLTASLIKGTLAIPTQGAAALVNMAWAIYHSFFIVLGIAISLRLPSGEEKLLVPLKINNESYPLMSESR